MHRRIVLAGTGSGVGKTTLTIGLMAALHRRGYVVQGFKCGPDYIDPTYHTAVTERVSRNLDSWMCGAEGVKEIFLRGSQGADISIIEGVMGLFDGKDPRSDEGSTADISRLLNAPIILVININSMARSAAAIVKGFQHFSEHVRIAGVIANRAGSEGHYKMVKEAIEQECGIPVIGYLKRDDVEAIPERHLGLVPSIGRGELNGFFTALEAKISEQIDIDKLLELAESTPLPVEAAASLFASHPVQERVKIAIAKDASFHFYYPENIELLEAYGAEIVYFSPLAGEAPPADADGLYMGGGFPEEFAERLAGLEHVKAAIKMAIEGGLPTLAECGGFMYLTESIEDTNGHAYPMVGIIPGKVKMQTKLAALGYREITGTADNRLLGAEEKAKGHEFHYSVYEPSADMNLPHAYETKGRLGVKQEGFVYRNLVAGYTHIHFASQPKFVQNWLSACASYRKTNK